jgi:hypothetical protein
LRIRVRNGGDHAEIEESIMWMLMLVFAVGVSNPLTYFYYPPVNFASQALCNTAKAQFQIPTGIASVPAISPATQTKIIAECVQVQ